MRIKVSESRRFNKQNSVFGSDEDLEEDIIHDETPSFFTGVGTTFYVIPSERLLKAVDRSEKKLNKVFVDILRRMDYDAINIDEFYGSSLDEVNHILYLCVTDGKPIKVNGEEVDPAEALDQYTIEDLAQYTENPSDDTILKYITMYQLNPEVLDSDTLDMIVQDNLEMGSHFKDIMKDYRELREKLGVDE